MRRRNLERIIYRPPRVPRIVQRQTFGGRRIEQLADFKVGLERRVDRPVGRRGRRGLGCEWLALEAWEGGVDCRVGVVQRCFGDGDQAALVGEALAVELGEDADEERDEDEDQNDGEDGCRAGVIEAWPAWWFP